MNLVIVIPTYNERGNIERLIAALVFDVFPTLDGWQPSVLVIDDSSPDGTAEVVRSLGQQWPNVHVLVGPKQGLGAALIRGMGHAVDDLHADGIVTMDADLSHDPAAIPSLLKKIVEGNDLVLGSRYIAGGSIPADWAWHRKFFSSVGNRIVRFALGQPEYRDWTTGFRALRRGVFAAVAPALGGYNGYTFQVAFLHEALLHGFRVAEVPIQFADRRVGKSKIAPAEYVFTLLQYLLRSRRRRLPDV